MSRTNVNDIEELKVPSQATFLISGINHLNSFVPCILLFNNAGKCLGLGNRIEKKATYLQELKEHAWIAVIIFLPFVVLVSPHDLNWLLCKILFAFMLLLVNYF